PLRLAWSTSTSSGTRRLAWRRDSDASSTAIVQSLLLPIVTIPRAGSETVWIAACDDDSTRTKEAGTTAGASLVVTVLSSLIASLTLFATNRVVLGFHQLVAAEPIDRRTAVAHAVAPVRRGEQRLVARRH